MRADRGSPPPAERRFPPPPPPLEVAPHSRTLLIPFSRFPWGHRPRQKRLFLEYPQRRQLLGPPEINKFGSPPSLQDPPATISAAMEEILFFLSLVDKQKAIAVPFFFSFLFS